MAFWLLSRLLAPGTPLPVDLPPLAFTEVEASLDPEPDGDSEDSIPTGRLRSPIPDLGALVNVANLTPPKATAVRVRLLKALRRAAEKRAAGVTSEKRRRPYDHAVRLVAACATVDPTPETMAWVANVRAVSRRYPAMQTEFDRCFVR